MQLTARDLKLFELLNRYQVLSSRQVRQLTFGNLARTNVFRRLRLLESKNFIQRAGYLEINPEMSEVVKMAFHTFLKEGSLSKACIWLNANGYRLRADKEGGGSLKRIGHFMVDNLQKMLRNKAYIGVKVFTIKGEIQEAPAVWPAIIDETTFARAGKMLKENRGRLKPERPKSCRTS